jgi:hypothetical protein
MSKYGESKGAQRSEEEEDEGRERYSKKRVLMRVNDYHRSSIKVSKPI